MSPVGFANLLERRVASPGGLFQSSGRRTWKDIHALSVKIENEVRPLAGLRVLLSAESPVDLTAALAALDRLRCEAVIGRDHETWARVPAIPRVRVHDGIARHSRPSGHLAVEPGVVGIFTSATTGPPRLCRWSMQELAGGTRAASGGDPGTWFSAYPLGTFAGLHTLTSALRHAGQLIVAPRFASVPLADFGSLQLACGTPTFWRTALALESDLLSTSHVSTISMGGEAATESLLVTLGSIYPNSRIVHVYATSETGPVFSVSDQRPGFPAQWIGGPLRSGARLEVEAGELLVLPAGASRTVRTGDMVSVSGGRASFVGRRRDFINVGGRKVWPMRVEEALRSISEITDARVFAHPNPMSGEVVAVELVLKPRMTERDARMFLRSALAKKLEPHELPRKITLTRCITTSSAGKAARTVRG